MPKPKPPKPTHSEHELDRATTLLTGEIKGSAERLAAQLFPGGPPGHRQQSRDEELALVARHWDDQAFRLKLLQRMAPPGPDGEPQTEGAEEFIKLYRDAILLRGAEADDLPKREDDALDSPLIPGLGPGQLGQMDKFGPPQEAAPGGILEPPPGAPMMPGGPPPVPPGVLPPPPGPPGAPPLGPGGPGGMAPPAGAGPAPPMMPMPPPGPPRPPGV